MKEETFKCGKCEKEFKSEDALKMHKSAKHSENLEKLEKEKPAKTSFRKMKNWIILAIILGVIFYGIFWMIDITGNSTKINENELEFDAPREEIHWHPRLTIQIDGEIQEIPPDIGITNSVHFPTHTHEDADVGVLHMENDNPTKRTVTLGYFFEVWGKTFNENCIFDYCTENGKLKMYVNGEENTEFQNYFMQDGDDILIEYISES